MTRFSIKTALIALTAVGAFLSFDAVGQNVTKSSSTAKLRPLTPTATTSSDGPDFAFPDKIAADADKRLKSALDSGDGVEVVNSLVCYSIARDCVSPELLTPAISRIDSVTRIEHDQCVKSLLNLLQATIYKDLYFDNRWNYDRREIPLDSISADYTEWSGAQFRQRINALLDSALTPRASLLASPVTDWKSVIKSNEYTATFYPTLYDMVVNSAISIKQQLRTEYNSILPARYVMPQLAIEPLPAYAAISPESREIHALYIDWISAHPDRLPPRLNATLNDIEFMSQLTSNADINSAYIAVYEQYRGHDWSVEALGRCYNSDDLAPLLTQAIALYPNYFRINLIRTKLAQLEQPALNINTQSNVAPGSNLKVNVTYDNLSKFAIKIAQLPLTEANLKSRATLTKELLSNPSKVINIETATRPLPFKSDTVVEIPITQPGVYYVWGTYDALSEKDSRNNYPITVICSDIAPTIISYDGIAYPYALNATTGQPVKGVSITQRNNNSDQLKNLGITNAEGTVKQNQIKSEGTMLFSLDNQIVSCTPAYSYKSTHIDNFYQSAAIFTSLPLYHHGDSVQWSLILYSSRRDEHHLDTNTDVCVKLFDANHSLIDSIKVTTDNSGRASGCTRLPDDGLSGNYTITVFDNEDDEIDNAYFKVNDYKLPTFTATVSSYKRGTNPDSTFTVTCQAKTYSGFPVAGARVSVELADAELYSWYYARNDRPFWTTDTVTDTNGNISITIPQHLFDLSPSDSDGFRISFDVTSQSGETCSCSQIINLGKPYDISLKSYGPFDIDKNLSTIKVDVLDAMGNPHTIDLDYSLISGSDTIAVNLSDQMPQIKPGSYKLCVTPRDTTLADIAIFNNITLYRTSGPSLPGRRMFIPTTNLTTDASQVKLLIGTEEKGTPILIAKVLDGVMDSQYWVSSKGGMEYIPVTIPSEAKNIKLSLTTTYDCKQSTATVDIKRITPQLDVEIESFRDKVTPLENEQISFKVNFGDQPSEAYLIMAMQSKALLSIAQSNFDFDVNGVYYYNPQLSNFLKGFSSRYYRGTLPNLKYPEIELPLYNLYGHTFGRAPYITNLRFHKLMATSAGIDADNGAKSEYDSLDEVVVTGYAAGVASEAAVEEQAEDAETTEDDSFNYRPSEIPLAFFAPMLSTDTEGRLTYTYTVPDANTAWTLKGIAYTRDLQTATFEREVIASHPVMVQPTLPRFLRYGDSASVSASVMNATDSTQYITTVVTLLDADNHELSTHTFTDTVAANRSINVSTPVVAPLTGTALIYRVKATAGNYTDGEQSILPLLPASQPVITSTQFYMQPDSTHMLIDIPAAGADNNTTLYMYDNPLWEVITALPSLGDDDAVTSIGAASRLYMAAIARGIMRRNPAIRQGLKSWLDSDRSDSTLTSMLNRNDELKQLSISATPWVREAMSDTERLTSLALLLDESNTTDVINRSIKTLSNLATPQGGFEWCPSDGNASLWATYRVLELFASLKKRGYMPSDKKVSSMLYKAIGYIDLSIATELTRNKNKGDYTSYTYIRSRLGGTQASPIAQKAIKLTVNNILKRWENEPVADKGVDAIILYHNGYPTMARRVIASIKAYSITKADNGTHWYGLDADAAARLLYAIETITPDDKALINSVAQWLIVNKTNTSWGNSTATSATIDALIGAIDVESAVNATADVTLNGRAVVSTTPQMPGMTVADISADVAGTPATLAIDKSGSMPVMGSIISRRVAAMDSIPASSCPSVSITKRYNKTDGTTVSDASDLTPGDRVNIQLVIKVTDQLDYVTVIDRRAACLEPVEQLSRYMSTDGLWYYREMTDSETRYFIGSMRPGTYVIDTAMNVVVPGQFSSGVATLQSQLNPGVTANSSTRQITVK